MARMKTKLKNPRIAIAALATAAVLALTVGPAVAHKASYASTVNLQIKDIGNTANQYSGKITSIQPRCAHFRKVTITSSGGFIASTTSNINGDYSVLAAKVAQGIDVTATLSRKVLSKKKHHRHICLPAAATHKAPK